MSFSFSNSSPRPPPPRPAPPLSAFSARNSPGSSSRNAPGAGWGIGGLSNYLSSSTRTSMTVPVVSADLSVATYEGITSIIRKNKTREAAALRRAAQKLKEEREQQAVAQATTANNAGGGADGEEGGRSEKNAREKAKAKVAELRKELDNLLMERAEIEKRVQSKWAEKIREFKRTSLQEEEEEINKLRQEHERELKELTKEIWEEEQQRASEETSRGKHKAPREDINESRKKRLIIDPATKPKHTSDGTRNKTTLAEKGTIRDVELDKNNGPNDNGGARDGEMPLQSAVKTKELEEITNAINCLNKTKSEMIWLLKQVITAEKKQKPR